ncbi:MAG: hypothetical protein WAS33_21600, partial [Candidatus Promineifilaceae bacterium]
FQQHVLPVDRIADAQRRRFFASKLHAAIIAHAFCIQRSAPRDWGWFAGQIFTVSRERSALHTLVNFFSIIWHDGSAKKYRAQKSS